MSSSSTTIGQIVSRSIQILAITDGRDKVGKMVQYGAKIIMWLLVLSKKDKTHARTMDILKKLYRALSDSRRVFRIGRCLGSVKELHAEYLRITTTTTAATATSTSTSTATSASKDQTSEPRRKLFHANSKLLWYVETLLGFHSDFLDDVAWSGKIGLVSDKVANRASRIADTCWMLGTIIELIRTTRELYRIHCERKRLAKEMNKLMHHHHHLDLPDVPLSTVNSLIEEAKCQTSPGSPSPSDDGGNLLYSTVREQEKEAKRIRCNNNNNKQLELGTANAVQVQQLQQQQRHDELKLLRQQSVSCDQEWFMAWLTQCKWLGDLGVAMNSSLDLHASDGFLGVCGFVAATVGAYKLWIKTK